MLGYDEIKELISSDVLQGADPERIGPVSYDLTSKSFHTEQGETSSFDLRPGGSVFVGTEEVIDLPADLAARVLLKNSRIRQGLTLDAPLYFPGHKTIPFFRITNVSSDLIHLDCKKGIAQLVFERLDTPTSEPYKGTFSDEFNYKGMASYSESYSQDMKRIEKKTAELERMEKRMYSTVMALLAVIAAIFSLANVNLSGMLAGSSAMHIIILNLATVGSFSLLAALLLSAFGKRGAHSAVVAGVISALAFAAAVILAVSFI